MAGVVKRGSLIVIEGCDRSGKTTQVKKLVDTLDKEGKPAKMMRFPDRTTGIGAIINSYLTCSKELDDHAVHLLFSANRWELEQEIMSTLKSGTHVIVDRYVYSGVAYSAAKPGLSLSWCKQPDIGLPRPDLVFFLDVSEAVAIQRDGFGGERYELTDFQRKVRENYTKLIDPSWVIVSSDGTMDEVENKLYSIVESEVGKGNKMKKVEQEGTKEDVKEEMRQQMRIELEEEIKEEIEKEKNEIKQEMKKEIMENMKKEIKEEMRNEVKKNVKENVVATRKKDDNVDDDKIGKGLGNIKNIYENQNNKKYKKIDENKKFDG